MDQNQQLEVAIIGAGFGGLGMAIKLKQARIKDFKIFEKSQNLGGTWYDNNYPGAACDEPAHLYCYSFEPKPEWSQKYAPQAEILAYLNHCANKYGIREKIEFDTEITQLTYDSGNRVWQIKTRSNRPIFARTVITACGQLNQPNVPNIKQHEAFNGHQFHSARWRHDVDLTDQNVAVIGNAASAIQFIPVIAQKVKKLTIYQRSPNWILPKKDYRYSQLIQKIFSVFKPAHYAYRYFLYWVYESRLSALKQNSLLGKILKWRTHRQMQAAINQYGLDPDLIPDYAIGCKRILTSSDYFKALARNNVELETQPINYMTASGIKSDSEKNREHDIVIYATGFKATDFLMPIQIQGTDDRNLHKQWQRSGAEAYLGMTMPGMPNFFMLYGPNTNLGHNSIIFMLECQFKYVLGCLKRLRTTAYSPLSIKHHTLKTFSEHVQQALSQSVWNSGCGSWYKTGQGKIVNNWPHQTLTYWWRTRKPKFDEFDDTNNP